MWKLCFILLVACLCIEAKGHAKRKHEKAPSLHDDIDFESDIDDDKRDAIAKPYDYSQYQSQYNTAATTNQAAAYTSSSTSSYPAATSSDSFSATQRAAVAAPQPAAAPAAAPAAPAPAAAPASPAPSSPAPATPAASPAPAAAAPAPAAPAAAPAPAPAPAAPAPAPAAAYSAPAPSTAAHTASQSRSDFPSPYQQSSVSSYYTAPPAAAPAPAPAPAAYYYSPPSTATATVAAAASQAASSTLAYTALKKGKSEVSKNTCSDDLRADHFCSKANNPCYCEENHHFMYNYCKRSCNWCSSGTTSAHRFWRIVNSALLPRSWIIKEIEFYTDKNAKKPLKVNPAKAFASTSYPGYFASNAFDGKMDTYWLPEGWYERQPGLDYIGMEFDQPVSVGAVKIVHQSNEKNATSKKMYLEESDFYADNYYKVFNMENPRKREIKKYSYVNCPIYWRRYDTGDDVYCVKTIAEFLTWQQARDKCATYGADLLSIDTPGENMFVNNELRLCGFTWIGLNDKKSEGNFSWSDGHPMSFKSWAGDESYYEQDAYLNSKQNCVAASRTGEWRPFHCENKFYAVCKMKLKLNDEDDEMENQGHYHHDRVSKKSSKGHKEEEDEEEEDEDASGNAEIELSGDDTDSEDAIKEIKKNVKKAQKTASHKKVSEDEEEDDEEEEDESGSGSDDDKEKTKTKKHVKGNRKEEISQVDDFLDLKH